MNILALDASTYVGTVAVLRDGKVTASAETAMRGAKVERLMPTVSAMIAAAGVGPDGIDLVVCGAGPGSFTSLRIAASIAKGIAFARSVPLHAVSSLVLLVAGLEPLPGAGRYLGILDALRGESYAQLVEVRSGAGAVLAAGEPMLVATESIAATARALEAVTVGPGGAIDAVPHARGVGNLLGAIHASRPVDLASWEPDYGRMAEAQVRWEAVHGRPLPQE